MTVTVVQHRRPELAESVRDARQFVVVPAALETEVMDQVELVGMKQMQNEAPGVEDQVVAEIELVDIDREAGYRRHDRRPHGAIQDHAIPLPVALRSDRHDWRCEI